MFSYGPINYTGSGQPSTVRRSDGADVPLAQGNSDFAAFLAWNAQQPTPLDYTTPVRQPQTVFLATLKAQLAKVPAPQFARLQTAAIAWAYRQNDPNTHDRADRAATDSKAAMTLVAQWLQVVPNGAISLGVSISGVQ